MKAFDFVQLAFLALGGEVRGKTSLQKKVYFLGELSGQLDELGYRPHFYGPYSDDVALATEELKAVGFIDQNVVMAFTAGETGFERRRYDYRLTEAGRRVGETKCHEHAEVWDSLTKAANVLRAAGDLDYMKLSIAAKTYFLLEQRRGSANLEELAQLASHFGWRVATEEVQQSARYLEKLGLVSLKTADRSSPN